MGKRSPMFSFLHFWQSYPGLFYGLAFTLGISCSLTSAFWLIFPCLSLWFPFLVIMKYSKYQEFLKPLALSLLIFSTAWLYTNAYYHFPNLPSPGLFGTAHVRIQNVSKQTNMFGKKWIYRCEIDQFFPQHMNSSIASLLPCLVTLPEKEPTNRPLANQEYWVCGKLVQTEKGTYLFKVSSKATWVPIPGSWSWAEQRYQWKKNVAIWIETQFSSSLSASFLAGLVTGEFDDHWMRYQFSRFGLQHLLAISGFHFAIVAGFLSFVLRLFLSLRLRIGCLLFCLGAYSFFLGPQPSILRAWIMCSLTLLGSLLEKQTTALNSLGLALIFILSYHPLLCLEIGFQLSFSITAAILLFYSPAQVWLYSLFPKRKLSEAIQMNIYNQYAYCILAFLRQGLALTLAVNLFALPFSLYYFEQFPWISLLYNLFYPFLASISVCLLFFGWVFFFLPFIGNIIHCFNDRFTLFLLQLTYQIPPN